MLGQTLILFLVLVGVLCLGLMLLFDSGQAVSKKVRLVNTADAAAMSVAVQQAKVMNFAAYMNRARVANEVMIAQLVSMWSWMNMLHTHTLAMIRMLQTLQAVAAASIWLSWLVPILRAVETAYSFAEKAVAGARNIYHTAVETAQLVRILSGINGLYANGAKYALDYGAQFEAVQVARGVVERNDPTARVPAEGWFFLGEQLLRTTSHVDNGLLTEYSKGQNGGEGMGRYRNVVMASRDKFSADRGDNGGIPYILSAGSWGGTDMVDFERWAGMDIMQVQVGPVSWLSGPMGWGGAQAIENKSGSLPGFDAIRSAANGGEGWLAHDHNNRTYRPYGGASGNAARLARQYPSVNGPIVITAGATSSPTDREDAYFAGYQGLQPYHDVKAQFAKTPTCETPSGRTTNCEAAGPRFTIYVVSDTEHARTTEAIDGIGAPPGGTLELRSDAPAGRLSAISTAQTYFNRPPAYGLFRRMVPRGWNETPSTDAQLEAGSLFSPYWQARLVDTPTEYYAAAGAMGALTGGGP